MATRRRYRPTRRLVRTVSGTRPASISLPKTTIPGLGGSKRDVLISSFPTISDLAEANPAAFIVGSKTVFKGIGADTLQKFSDRAKLIADGGSRICVQP